MGHGSDGRGEERFRVVQSGGGARVGKKGIRRDAQVIIDNFVAELELLDTAAGGKGL